MYDRFQGLESVANVSNVFFFFVVHTNRIYALWVRCSAINNSWGIIVRVKHGEKRTKADKYSTLEGLFYHPRRICRIAVCWTLCGTAWYGRKNSVDFKRFPVGCCCCCRARNAHRSKFFRSFLDSISSRKNHPEFYFVGNTYTNTEQSRSTHRINVHGAFIYAACF